MRHFDMSDKEMKTIKVVAAIIKHGDKVFATQRGYGELKGGWEFPGGKIEAGETPQQALIREIKESEGTFRHDNVTRHKCPQCGRLMLEVNGRHGRMLVCQDRECGHRETISRRTNARCPICHKKMELIGKGDAQRFVCSCGHKEKLSAFQERRKREGKGANKRDVAAYMKKQAKEANEPVNNAFAEALKNLKL